MTLQQAVASVLAQYATFSGRARRSEYWYWTLATVLLSIATTIVDEVLGSMVVGWVITLATLIPSLAVGARRLHDTGRSGWLQLLGIIPIIGWILLLFWFIEDSHADNQHGPNPKGQPTGAFGEVAPPPPAF